MEKALASYYKQEEGYETMLNEYGFCAYRYDSENKNFFVGHFAIEEEARKKGESHKFFRKMKFRAKALGAERLVGNLFLNNYNANEYNNKVLIHLKHGYKIIDVNDKCITVMKEI
jgi:GNAT superfamily N-acetyltransferase